MTSGHPELVAAISSEIIRNGPIPFVRFMELAATSSGCPNDTDHSFVSVKTARTNPRKRADVACPSGRGKEA